MDPDKNGWDDEWLAALFASAENEGVPPDREFLDRLRERSTEVFAQQATRTPSTTPRRSPMMTYAIRLVASAAAAAAVFLGFTWNGDLPDRAEAGFDRVLHELASAETLHLQITQDGQSNDAWVRHPGLLRINRADGTYQIARGSREWLVDEKANRAASRKADYFHTDERHLDPISLLSVSETVTLNKALKLAPAERIQQAGHDLDRYVVHVSAEGGRIRVEAYADAKTQMLRSLVSTAIRGVKEKEIAKVELLTVDEPIDEKVFVVGDTLTEDGRIGKVTDPQGIVSVKPVMHRRWAPVCDSVILKPGDWLRTDIRGANAVALRLVKNTAVIVGPGSLVELPTPRQIKLASGELRIAAEKNAPVELVGPDGTTVTVDGTAIYRINRQTQQLAQIDAKKPPLWLQGFDGTTAHDSIGSLVANVDGRNVPLTVGYHKVSVDIRDQIARTVIEESFVNRTKRRLEGVFYFPLPQDASISGFGMWIGNKLVEADVVEKQRAREIYETILRERRDPGLLEWTGGNLFKARVFPIEPLSEKRIKITYTQVLPMLGDQYRYSYGLQSEMLKLHPLRELAMDVRIHSVLPLADVSSPTHMTRIETTDHSAHVEFTAQEYAPTRDFEVVIQTKVSGTLSPKRFLTPLTGSSTKTDATVMIPHRRGEDGYFLLLLMPPVSNGQWQRQALPDGEPLELLVLADTSGSMDESSREKQEQLVGSLFGSLTREDRFNLATCDVECDWVFQDTRQATAENIAAARDFLTRRVSLGWTDLDKAFQSALSQCGPKTQVIYIGDGVVNTVNADPVAFGKRLRRLGQGKPASFHAVSVGSSFESSVLSAIASLGGGSVRQVSGEKTPQQVAADLLGEMTQPVIRDLQVDFKGMRVARVYPERLPNLAAGMQQILIGRYLPEGEDQEGEVIVTGSYDGKPVRFSTKVSLKDAEHGNSFIPRLWARMHLDSLLQEGTSAAIKDEIIALSEEYHIITPYTSLLVLESDADRERFKVKRRFQMRDGEKFFAEGRNQADFELLQKQMRLAGNWRLGLRRQVLRELVGLGRDASMFQEMQYPRVLSQPRGAAAGAYSYGGRGNWRVSGFEAGFAYDGKDTAKKKADLSFGDDMEKEFDFEGGELADGLNEFGDESLDLYDGDVADDRPLSLERDFRAEPASSKKPARPSTPAPSAPRKLSSLSRLAAMDGAMPYYSRLRRAKESKRESAYLSDGLRRRPSEPRDASWLTNLFPQLPAPPAEPDKSLDTPWPAEAIVLSESLLRTRQLAEIAGGLSVQRKTESFDPRWNQLIGRSEMQALVSPAEWLTRAGGGRSQTLVQWCDTKERGTLSVEMQLGRRREAAPMDLRYPPLGLSGYVLQPIHRTYHSHSVRIEPQGRNRTLLVLQHSTNLASAVNILIDTERSVILWIENRQHGKVTSTTRFEDFVQVAGNWWATRHETLNADGKRHSLTTLTFKELKAETFKRQMAQQLTACDGVQFLREPATEVADAKQALLDNTTNFDDRMALAAHFAQIQDWIRTFEHLDAAEKLAEGKPGLRWVRNVALNQSRRREELRQRIQDEATKLATSQSLSLFLAEHLLGQAASVFEANEMLQLLDGLKPVFDKQLEYLQTAKRWTQQRANYLERTGQADQVLKLRRQLAEQYPHDYAVHRDFANALSRTGEYDAAYAWLDRVVRSEARWLPHEDDSLRSTYTNLLERQGRYKRMAEYLAGWIAQSPSNQTAYAQYVSALVRTDQEKKANRLVVKWLKDARRPAPLEDAVSSRLHVAVAQALGQGHRLYTSRIDERWMKPLAETALFFAAHESLASVSDRIMTHYRFRQTDACRDVRRQVVVVLTEQVGTLPAARLSAMVIWVIPNDPAVEAQDWRRIAKGLEKRWADDVDPTRKHQIAAALIRILSSPQTRLTAEEYLTFLRRQLQEGPKQHQTTYVGQLFDALLKQPWSAEHEDEAFGLLPRLSDAKEPADRLRIQVSRLYHLTDRMVQARYDARMAEVEHPEELTRTEMREKQRENLRLARTGFADRLRAAKSTASEGLAPWMQMERFYLDVQIGRNLDVVRKACWEVIGLEPQLPGNSTDTQTLLNEILHYRCLTTLANLAARRDAKPADVKRLIDYFARGITAAADNDDLAFVFQLFKYRLLIALDRPKDLEQSLQSWIRPDKADNYWRRSLGYLASEQGRIKEAIRLFEKIEADDELGPSDYRALAGWYMVNDQKQKHERALIEAFKWTEEWQLRQWLAQKLRPWQRRDVAPPSELDKDVLRIFAALFEKAGHPQNYEWQLRQFYQATRDFRLLGVLADAVVGHTAGRVYPFLQSIRSILGEIRDEATADSVVEHVAEARQRAKSAVDHRALDLLEVLIERRSCEVLNQPGPHTDRALAALKRAFQREWSEGEPRLMADLLAELGKISQKPLADEQVRQLEVLHTQSDTGTIDRLHIAHALARTYWSYSRHDNAIDLLESALAEHEAACNGVLPTTANMALDRFIDYLESRRRFARGETVLFEQLKHPANVQQTYWLRQRLYQLYNEAIRHDGDVTLGSGQTLYRAATAQLQQELGTGDHNHRYNLINKLCTIYRSANEKKLEGVFEDLRGFAFNRLPEVLVGQTNNYQTIVSQVAHTLRDVIGARSGLEFLIERIENEPSWFRLNNQDGWSRNGYQLARWRSEVANGLGDLEPRLLRIVVEELKKDLRSQYSRNRNIYHRRNGNHFWPQKADDFARAADEVYEERKQSGSTVAYIADYFYWGLDRHARAIEILLAAHKDKVLDESGQSKTVDFLHRQNRYGESIPILEPLVELRPETMKYRTWLMHACFRVGRQEDLLALLEQTDEFFHQEGRWREPAIAALGHSCLENKLFERSVALYEEVINIHQRTQPNRGIGNGTLSSYYWNMAQAYSGLKKTAEAVDAACGAIISWGPRHDQRAQALSSLEQVLRDAVDLDQYVKHLDQQTVETGLDNAIVRKALGKVYFDKGEHAKAIPQLKRAVELQPNDTETHEKLVACYEKQGDQEAVIRQLLESVRLSRRNIQLYKSLAERYEKLERAEDAERARTSIVEALPNESESHTLLAEIRQAQNRWVDAIQHWQQVASIRALEPTGLLKLTAAQVHEKQWDEAAETVRKLRARAWPVRFGDIDAQARNLERQIETARTVRP